MGTCSLVTWHVPYLVFINCEKPAAGTTHENTVGYDNERDQNDGCFRTCECAPISFCRHIYNSSPSLDPSVPAPNIRAFLSPFTNIQQRKIEK